jgi:ABC-type nitrate/sulfonate/bicarbonate transport system permease component
MEQPMTGSIARLRRFVPRFVRQFANFIPPARGLLPLVALLVLWEVAQRGLSPNFPRPSLWWTALVNLAANGMLRPAVEATLWTFVAGLSAGCIAGFGLGLIIGTSVVVREWSGMLLEFLRALPPPVTIPIAVLIAGYTPSMKITVIAITASWPVLLNTVAGVANIRSLLFDVARSLRFSRAESLWTIVIPATIPDFLLGVRVAISIAIITTLLVEMFTGLPGIGVLMMLGQRSYDSAQVFGLLAIVGALAYLLGLIFAILEGVVLRRWPPRHGALS